MARVNDLGKDSVPGLVVRIAIPSMFAQFVSVLYSIVDRMFVGNIPGDGSLCLAGIGICGPVVAMLGAFAFLVGIGGSPLVGISMGEKDDRKAQQILANCFVMMCSLAVVLTAVAIFLREPMLRLFGASDVTYPYAEKYFLIYICGTIFAMISAGMNQFIIVQGFSQNAMIAVLIGAVLNIVLDPIFIYLFDMGISGAALATVISQAASAAYVLWFLFGKRTRIKITFGGYDLSVMLRVLKIGFTPFIIIAIDNVMIIAMNALLQKYGGSENGDGLITCNTIVQSFMLIMTMPLGGISGGTQGILSYNYGASNPDRVLKAQRYIMLLCVCYTAIMFVLARTVGSLFASAFTSDPALIQQASKAIRICTMAAVPLGIQYEIVDGFTGIGQVQYALPLSFWRKTVYFIALFTLPAIWGADSIFYAETISDIIGPAVSATVYLCCIKKVLYKKKSLNKS